MTAVTHSFELPSNIGGCCDDKRQNTAYECVQVRPAGDGAMYLEATNSFVLAVVPVKGTHNGDMVLMPHKLGTRTAGKELQRVELNGEWRKATGKGNKTKITVASAVDPAVRPVPVRRVVPDSPTVKWSVSLNAEQLLTLAKALHRPGEGNLTVTLHMGEENDAILVEPAGAGQIDGAFGLQMPVGIHGGSTIVSRMTEYRRVTE